MCLSRQGSKWDRIKEMEDEVEKQGQEIDELRDQPAKKSNKRKK